MLATLFLVSMGLAAPAPAQDPLLERDARSAARTYESLIRRRAPYGRAGVENGRCDEVIGRFCFRFGGDDPPSEPASEDPDVVEARRRAIEAHRRWLAADPSEGEAAGALIRYLIEDGRAREAVSVARTHEWASPGAESRLFLGLALHEAGEIREAEAVFDSARLNASVEERETLDDVSVLLAPAERSWYTDLRPEARKSYHARFWAFSDPSRLEPGNERRSAHYARHAWIRILDGAPRAAGAVSWGTDRAEILLRYGLPRRRERVRPPPFRLSYETTVVSYYDPRAVPLVPEALGTAGIPAMPGPGVRPELERDTVRSAYAPSRARRVLPLTGQVTRLPAADGRSWILRLDVRMPPDTAPPTAPVAPRAQLTVLDTLGRGVAAVESRATVRRDASTVIRADVTLPPGRYVYQLELVDDSTGLMGLARYSVTLPEGALRLSDPLLAEPESTTVRSWTELTPFADAILAAESRVLVHAEVGGLARAAGTARYVVQWGFEPSDEPSALARAVRWLGRALGLGGPEAPAGVRWEGVWGAEEPVPISFVLELRGVAPGDYRLRLTVRDRVSGREATSYRPVRVEPPAARPGGPGDRDRS